MEKKIKTIMDKQREFFNSKKTLSYDFRIQSLNRLRQMIEENEQDIYDALYKDLSKSDFEAYQTELGLVLSSISHAKKNLRRWMKPERKMSPLANFLSTSNIRPEPFGLSLVVSPWNYPILLSLDPIVGAMAAGNCIILKTSDYSKYTSDLLEELIAGYFDEAYFTSMQGDRYVNQALFEADFDYIFYTGSPKVGSVVMEAASKNLTPVTLELGGKSPAIVDETANIDLSAKRLAWGKLINAGQTCVAPDYILAHESIKDELVAGINKYIKAFYGDDPKSNPDYPKIINEDHMDRLVTYIKDIDPDRHVAYDKEINKLNPTIVESPPLDSDLMQDEIFGPILPIISYKDFDGALNFVRKRPKPLAAYIFSTSNDKQDRFLEEVSFGGGCINDTLVHLATDNLPFGGVGTSGMGAYHGKYSFDTFSNFKPIVKKSNLFDLDVRYHPKEDKLKLIKKVLS